MKSRIWIVAMLAGALVGAGLLGTASESGKGHWPQWRGPQANGMAPGRGAPASWSDAENVKWKAEIPGRGHSSPIIWGDRIFLTTAVAVGAKPEPPKAAQGEDTRPAWQRRAARRSGPQAEHRFEVLSLDRRTGKTLWRKTATTATPHEGFHSTYGSFASNSPVTDGERLFAFFGSRGVFCYDLGGNLIWKKDFGVQMKMRLAFGEGTAAVLEGDTLLLNFDHQGGSFLSALDKRSGQERWRTERDEQSAWSPPLVVEHQGRKQIIVSATKRVRAYDFKTGELIWECGGLGYNVIPAPVHLDGVVYVMSGDRDSNLMAIRLGGEGDLTGSEAILWSNAKGISYTPSPVLHEGKLYVLTDNGILSCYEAATGKPYYQERLPKPYKFKASPVGIGGKLYLASESGDVVVVKMGETFEVLATNTLEGQMFIASPAVAEGEVFLRGPSTLFCISDAAE